MRSIISVPLQAHVKCVTQSMNHLFKTESPVDLVGFTKKFPVIAFTDKFLKMSNKDGPFGFLNQIPVEYKKRQANITIMCSLHTDFLGRSDQFYPTRFWFSPPDKNPDLVTMDTLSLELPFKDFNLYWFILDSRYFDLARAILGTLTELK